MLVESPPNRMDAYTEEVLELPLNFILTEAAGRLEGRIQLLKSGDYIAKFLRTYESAQRCDGCETREKAKKLVIIEEHLTGEQYQIGLDCMAKLYGVDIRQIIERGREMGRFRLALGKRISMVGASLETLLTTIEQVVRTYLPLPSRYLPRIEAVREDPVQGPALMEGLLKLYEHALYVREWQEDAPRARARWTALRSHPRFHFSPHGQSHVSNCDQALKARAYLDEARVYALNRLLCQAQRYTHSWVTLVAPENCKDEQDYHLQLQIRLDSYQLNAPEIDHRYFGKETLALEQAISFQKKKAYGVSAVLPARLEAEVSGLKAAFRVQRQPVLLSSSGDVEEYVQPRIVHKRRNADNELEEFEVAKAQTFRYCRVAVALLEPWFECYTLWNAWQRPRLEFYTP